jgi:hypothetical protein
VRLAVLGGIQLVSFGSAGVRREPRAGAVPIKNARLATRARAQNERAESAVRQTDRAVNAQQVDMPARDEQRVHSGHTSSITRKCARCPCSSPEASLCVWCHI